MQLELLAPAKNKDIGIAAIDCGADALYIAGPAFGARESAGNTFRDIEQLCRYAHRYGVRVYMVVNTILYDSELEEARTSIIKGYEAGVDAIIVQDLGVLKMELPPIDLYASTQTNIRTPEQARFLESLGFKRLILARELSLEQIRAIREATSCELESFVHGALCVSYSGQCYLSCHLTGRSANRGSCIQACRSNYDLADSTGKVLVRQKPILSLKDFSLEKHIPDLVEAGITSFKIEGRLKNESYVRNVTRHYRRIIDNLGYEKSSFGTIEGGFTPHIEQTFSRGYTTYFLTGKRGQWNSGDSAKAVGEEIGTITRTYPSNKFESKFSYQGRELSNGDGLFIITPQGRSTGVRADKVEGNIVTVKYTREIAPGAKVYRNFNQKFEKELQNNLPKRILGVKVDIAVAPDKIEATAICENGATARGMLHPANGVFEAAANPELALKNLKGQMEKVSEYLRFSVSGVETGGDFIPFLPLSAINSLRRELSGMLEEKIGEQNGRRGGYECRVPKITGVILPPEQKIKLNCSNQLSRSLYRSIGIDPANAFELDRDHEGEYSELMRTKYCIRYELGLCGKKVAEPWYLINNGKKLRLKFDCKNCEMVVL